MSPLEALQDLLERLEATCSAAVLVSEQELSQWTAEAVRALKSQKLIVRASPAVSAVCPGCEQECTMLVHTLPAGTRPPASFVICDKRDDINRVEVPAERLRQWRCGLEAVGAFVAQTMGLRPESRRQLDAGLVELGLMTGKKRSQMLCLRASDTLELVAGENAVPLVEVVRFEADGYSVDREIVRRLVDTAATGDNRYTPSNTRREARKLETQARHERWRKEYNELKKRRPEMSDVWYSQQIAKMQIAQTRDAETIRKHMKR
jgi:hypothetical protein